MITKTSRSKCERFMASGTCLFLPLAALPVDVEFNTVASWYGPGFHGKKTASGELYDQNKLTAANKQLPFGTKLEVKNLNNGRSCIVVINDRGPYVHGRGLDLSREAARRIGMQGTAPVYCCTVNPAKQTNPQSAPKPADQAVQSVDLASAKTRIDPELLASVPDYSMTVSSHAASHMVARHRLQSRASAVAVASVTSSVTVTRIRMARKHSHVVQYVAFEGAHRTQYDNFRNTNKFVRNYRA